MAEQTVRLDRAALESLLFAFAIDVQKARREGESFDIQWWLNRFLVLVGPATIDRDALVRHIRETVWDDYEASATAEEVADGILALARPVAGVVLSPEEKALIIDVLREIPDTDLRMAEIRPSRQQEIDERRALADRLEAGS